MVLRPGVDKVSCDIDGSGVIHERIKIHHLKFSVSILSYSPVPTSVDGSQCEDGRKKVKEGERRPQSV